MEASPNPYRRKRQVFAFCGVKKQQWLGTARNIQADYNHSDQILAFHQEEQSLIDHQVKNIIYVISNKVRVSEEGGRKQGCPKESWKCFVRRKC